MNKVLSIIIPTYNAEPYLEKCLQSIASIKDELLDLCEVIVVNDGTPDDSMVIAEKFVNQYPNVYKIVNKENGGHGSAINKGVEFITSRYFKVLDADDWVNSTELEKTIINLKEEKVDVVITGYNTYHIIEEVYEKYSLDINDFSKTYTLTDLMDVWEKIQWGMTLHGIIYSREFYQGLNYKLTEGVFYEDQEYATIPVCYAETVRCMDTYMYVYRIGDVNQSVSDESQVKRLPHAQKVIESMMDAGSDVEKFSLGGDRYWLKKTTMMINGYYETACLKKGGQAGREAARALESMIQEKNEMVAQVNRKKYLVFRLLGYIGISDKTYRKWLGVSKRF